MMKIERVSQLSKEHFFQEYLVPGVPVIVTDAMNEWDIEQFTPAALNQRFGSRNVQVYDDLFALQDVPTLSEYLLKHFNKPENQERSKEYIRWYTQLKDVDFLWADDIFEELKSYWDIPYFLPESSTIIPYCPESGCIKPNESRFPYKGIFISGRGARTRLHRDPWNSNAVLCQFYGEKRIYLYSPDQAKYVMNGSEFVDISAPDKSRFHEFKNAQITAEVVLSPGEIILFPSGWFHDVTSISDSVSITWNFIHSSGLDDFCNHLSNYPEESELEIVQFFLKHALPKNASSSDIIKFIKKAF